VPGQVYYNSTRKIVLQGVDGVIFIADSDPEKMDENIQSYENLIENLREYGKDIREVPHVIQFNKRDLPGALTVEQMDKAINRFGVPTFEAVARTGVGVFPTLKVLAEMVLESINKMDNKSRSEPAPRAAQAPAARRAAPAASQVAGPATTTRAGSPMTMAPAAMAAPTATAARRAAVSGPATPPERPARSAPGRVSRRASTRGGRGRSTKRTVEAAKGGGSILFAVAFTILLAAAVAGVVFLLSATN
jgi:hypothetical protein